MELCQRLTSEEGDDEEKEEKEVKGSGRQTLLRYGASLGLCRLVFLSKIKIIFLIPKY